MTEGTEPTPAPVVDATAEAILARLAALEGQTVLLASENSALTEQVQGLDAYATKLEERIEKLEAAKPALPLRGSKVDAGAVSKLGAAVYRLQEHALPMEKDESLLDL